MTNVFPFDLEKLMQLNYDAIAPLIQNVQAQGRTVQFVFMCLYLKTSSRTTQHARQ